MKRTLFKHAMTYCAAGMIAGLTACAQLSVTETLDRPEPGLQGQSFAEDQPGSILAVPYSAGVNLIGHTDVMGRDSNIQMAWVGECAFISSSSPNFLGWGVKAEPETFGVAVIDVSNPQVPETVTFLRDKGAMYSSEAMDAVDAGDRKVLAASIYQGGEKPSRDSGWLSLYDVSDCAAPKLTAEYRWPVPVHAIAVSPNGQRVYATEIHPFKASGGLHVLDISDMQAPKYLGKFNVTRADGSDFEFAVHDISFSNDENRIYAGVLGSHGGDLNKGIKPFPPSSKYLGPDGGGFYILDNSEIASGKADPSIKLIGTAEHGGWHSPVPATIDGKPYVVSGGELGACPGAWPKITDISAESAPELVGEFKLEMNRAENCPPLSPTEKATGGISGDPGTASLHYNDVDSATDTKLGLFNFMWAGLRIADLRDPASPTEIAYFKPGDACGGQVRYKKDTDHIWLACGQSGFYVLEIKPEVRKKHGL